MTDATIVGMDDENLHQEAYFDGFVTVINNLDSAAADFEFQMANLQSAVRITHFLNVDEKQKLSAMLHIVRTCRM